MHQNAPDPNKLNSKINLNPFTSYYAIGIYLVCIVCITIIAYSPGLSGDYPLDDLPNILENQRLKIQSLSFEDLTAAAFSSDSGPLRRPISMVSFALNNYFFGTDPYSFKITNLVIHILNGLLLFALTILLFNAHSESTKKKISKTRIIWLATAASLAWLLHTINLTAVLYVVQRMTSLATLFMISALCIYFYARMRMLKDGSGLLLLLLSLPICFTLGMLCKENTILLPLFIAASELILFRFQSNHGTDKRLITIYAACAGVFLVSASMWWWSNSSNIFNGYDLRDFTLIERVYTEARIVVLYIKWILFPNLHELGLYHDDIVISTGLLDPYTTLLSIFTLTLLCVIAISLRKRAPIFSLGIIWFFIGHLLESTIYPLELAYEHRNYFPSYCILIAILSLLLYDNKIGSTKKYLHIGLIAYLFLLFTLTFFRADQWKDNLSHAQFSAEHHPNSARAVFTLGRIYANLNIGKHIDNNNLAISTLERAAILDPSGITPEITLILFSQKLKLPLNDNWLKNVYYKLRQSPVSSADTSALHKYINSLDSDPILNDQQIMEIFDLAMKSSGLKSTPRIHADLLTIQADYLINQRQEFQKALELMLMARNLQPNEPQYRINLFKLALELGDKDLAISELSSLKNMNRLNRLDADITNLENKLLQPNPNLNN